MLNLGMELNLEQNGINLRIQTTILYQQNKPPLLRLSRREPVRGEKETSSFVSVGEGVRVSWLYVICWRRRGSNPWPARIICSWRRRCQPLDYHRLVIKRWYWVEGWEKVGYIWVVASWAFTCRWSLASWKDDDWSWRSFSLYHSCPVVHCLKAIFLSFVSMSCYCCSASPSRNAKHSMQWKISITSATYNQGSTWKV
jgi:hypothetical protein